MTYSELQTKAPSLGIGVDRYGAHPTTYKFYTLDGGPPKDYFAVSEHDVLYRANGLKEAGAWLDGCSTGWSLRIDVTRGLL